jgi:ABC-type proline/glycine betaine transport system substrate-binding protein
MKRGSIDKEEGSMSRRVGGRFTALLGISVVAVVGLVSSGSALGGAAQSCGTVTLNEQAWTGSTANTYVAKYVLEKRLGCSVKITKITEIPVFQAMADGKVDAVLEDWNHVAQYQQFVTKQKSVVLVRANGLVGHIGWFIPRYLLKQNPGFKTWRGLKGKESLFRSPESGSQGMFLGVGGSGALHAADQAEEAGHLLLVDAAVPEREPRPRRGEAAGTVQGL